MTPGRTWIRGHHLRKRGARPLTKPKSVGRPPKRTSGEMGIFFDANGNPKREHYPVRESVWEFDEDDFGLYALLCDPIFCAELLWEDPNNREYAGCYIVRDYQYPLWRINANYAGYETARNTGKTESIKGKTFSHAFRRIAEDMLVTAPELIHLLPLTDAIEHRIRSVRLTREFLDARDGRTGFTHRPFGVDFLDRTKIVGRIPQKDGRGVKGMHVPDLIIDESQDYPEKGWVEIHEVVTKDHRGPNGTADFTYTFYGVPNGSRQSGFNQRTSTGTFKITKITALQRPGWCAEEKAAAIGAYGATSAPDYRRNILGETGAAASPFFVLSRLVACQDQNRESAYNTDDYVIQKIPVERLQEGLSPAEALELPSGLKAVWGGSDLGLTIAPTTIHLYSEERIKGVDRLKLVRRIHLERWRTRQIRQAYYAIADHFGSALKGFGLDETGLGFPIWQEMEDDELAPPAIAEVFKGYFFNAKVPVGVDRANVREAERGGHMRDQYGAVVEEIEDPYTGQIYYITRMPMIEAATRYLRQYVDTGFFLLPFDQELILDMQGESVQRVKRVAGLRQKPNMFHDLDAMRAMAMVREDGQVKAQIDQIQIAVPVMELSL